MPHSILGLTDDLVSINKRVCQQLWRMIDVQNGIISSQTPRLIFPGYQNKSIRISEQEARFTYASVIEKSLMYLYSVETPTQGNYSFSGAGSRSGLTDLTLYKFKNGITKQVNVEFKYGNPTQKEINEVIEKLATEQVVGNYFHLLKNIDSSTLPVLFKKLNNAFSKINVNTSFPIIFCFVVLDTKWAILKELPPGYGSQQNYCNQFFHIDYTISKGKVLTTNNNGWDIINP